MKIPDNQSGDNGSTPIPPLQLFVRPIALPEAVTLVDVWHYSKIMPRLTKNCLGAFRDGQLVAAATFGWGRRPMHTIRNLFPSLTRKEDYLEFGKLCVADPEPKNTESWFISQCIRWLKKEKPEVKVLYSWADGLWGKPGYIYQASNFLYGGFIWTDRYITDTGRILNPSSLRKVRPDWVTNDKHKRITEAGGAPRPSKEELKSWGWKRLYGKQYRYLYFLCNSQEKERLLRESKITWTKDYPKHADLEWHIEDLNTSPSDYVMKEKPSFNEGLLR